MVVEIYSAVCQLHKGNVQKFYKLYQKDRMKKQIVTIILLLIFIVINPASADDEHTDFDPNRKVSDEMIEILSQNLENIFSLIVKRDYYNKPSAPLYSEDSSDSIIEIVNDAGRHNIRMFVNADGIHDHMAYEIINDEYLTDFMMTMDVTFNDTWPMDQGGCFVGFTNYGVSAFDDAVTVALVTDRDYNEIYYKEHLADRGTHYPLQSRWLNPVKLTLVHLFGHTYVFMEDKFEGQLHDGESGPFRLMYGTVLFENGDSVGCTFDNLVIRKVSSKR